jgi:Xaa-Pro aminopeptidase
MSSRLEKLREKLAEQKLDALIVSGPRNQLYLAGFAGHEDFDSILLVSKDDARVATDSRYWEVAENQAHGFSLVKIKRGEYDYTDALRDFAKEHDAHTIGFEANHVPYARYRDWQRAARKGGAKLVPMDDLVNRLRAVKDEGELDKIRRAVRLTDEAFEHFRTHARPGMTEKQGAWLIELFMREHGGDGLAFNSIVASGPNAALPHAEPTDRTFEEGEPITVDIGARIDHYNADLTRTICLGAPSAKFQEVYQIVLKAQQAVEKKTRAGLRGKRVDGFARRVIEKAGYGENFGHGLGHGVGLAVHELPRAGKISKDVLEPNMTLTVEPGIYLPGWGGVRLEDLVLITPDGVEILSQATKEPVVKLNGV